MYLSFLVNTWFQLEFRRFLFAFGDLLEINEVEILFVTFAFELETVIGDGFDEVIKCEIFETRHNLGHFHDASNFKHPVGFHDEISQVGSHERQAEDNDITRLFDQGSVGKVTDGYKVIGLDKIK